MTNVENTAGTAMGAAAAADTVAAAGAAGAAGERAGVAVLGFGTAAVNAIIALRNAGYAGPVHVFTDGGDRPYSPILTSYYAGGRKEYDQCFPWSDAELAQLSVIVHAGCAVEELDAEAHAVRTAEGAFAYEKCLIATGARPMAYGFPQVEGGSYEPLKLRTMEDAERLREALCAPRCRRILVSGASMVALKTLEAALDRGVQVTLVGMNGNVLDMNALPQAARRIEARLRDFGAELRLGQTVARVERIARAAGATGAGEGEVADAAVAAAADGAAAGAAADVAADGDWQLRVTFSNGDVDVFDEISVSHGMRSNLEFLPAGALETDRALLVDEFMRTSNPDVYAAGDVAQALELVSGDRRIVGIWKSAALQGACAGTAMAAELAGEEPRAAQAYAGAIATNTICVQDSLFLSAGASRLEDGWRAETDERDDMTVIRIWAPCGEDAAGAPADAAMAADAPAVAAASEERLVGFNIACDHDEPGSYAYDLGAMLTMRILKDAAKR